MRVGLGISQNSPTNVLLRQPCSQFFPVATPGTAAKNSPVA